jgi:hypothetical protein
MNSRPYYILPLFLFLALAATGRAKSDLATPEQRKASISLAESLAQPVTPSPLPSDLRDPFVFSREAAKTEQHVSTADREVLAAIAPHVKPSGVVQVGGSPMLLLREKKLKVGDYLTITFEGNDYVIKLSAISHSSFTLRLNKEEITQPINP